MLFLSITSANIAVAEDRGLVEGDFFPKIFEGGLYLSKNIRAHNFHLPKSDDPLLSREVGVKNGTHDMSCCIKRGGPYDS